jgi:SAM-dependent methyltransferase
MKERGCRRLPPVNLGGPNYPMGAHKSDVQFKRPLWNDRRRQPSATWYLDPLVAAQKGSQHRALINRWTAGFPVTSFLKTDAFEEANGDDQLLFDLFPGASRAICIDISWPTLGTAARRSNLPAAEFCATDVRCLAMRSGCVDLVLSTSTLDHFASADDIRVALHEIARVVRPGGLVIITLDNPQNPFYWALRWASRCAVSPFPLGCTLSRERLERELENAGLRVEANAFLIHNPRGVSTLLFLALRRLLGARADRPIRLLLSLFAQLGRLPSRRFTACFIAARARKPL